MVQGNPGPAAYHALFLAQGDLPTLRMIQDHRDNDWRIETFERFGGTYQGSTLWQGAESDDIWRLYDERWVFPAAPNASAYHQARLSESSGGGWLLPTGVTYVGDECTVFGDTAEFGVTVPPIRLTSFVYQFRVGNVVACIDATQGVDAGEGALKVGAVGTIAAAAADRIRTVAG